VREKKEMRLKRIINTWNFNDVCSHRKFLSELADLGSMALSLFVRGKEKDSVGDPINSSKAGDGKKQISYN
jgi:hypothetical protein